MKFHRHPAGLCVSCALGLLSQSVQAGPSPFDGTWSVALVCPDTTSRNGPVKGYQFDFEVSITDGAIQGTYGAPGHPSSIVFTGRAANDGALEIAVSGNTGRSEYTVGRVARGSQYDYTMQGALAGSTGQASRRELRPCTAAFQKRQPG